MRDFKKGILLLDLFQALQVGDNMSGEVDECTRKVASAVGEGAGRFAFQIGEQPDGQEFLMHLRTEMKSALRKVDELHRLQYCMNVSSDQWREQVLRGGFRAPSGNEYLAAGS